MDGLGGTVVCVLRDEIGGTVVIVAIRLLQAGGIQPRVVVERHTSEV